MADSGAFGCPNAVQGLLVYESLRGFGDRRLARPRVCRSAAGRHTAADAVPEHAAQPRSHLTA